MVRKCFHVSNDFDLNLPVLSLQINFYVNIQILKDFGTGEMIKVVVFGVLWMCLWDCSEISTWHSCVLPIHEPGCVSSTSDLSQVTPSAVAHLGMTFWWKTTLRLQYSNDVESFIRNRTQVILDYFCSIPERILSNSFKTKQKTCRTRKYLVPKWFSPAGCSLMLSHIDLTLENELMSFYNFERCLLIKRNYYRNKRIVFYHNSFAMYTWNFSK